jgi:hypothetical protein
MPKRTDEVRHLADADEHIRRGERSVAELAALVTAESMRGADVTRARKLLATAEEALAQMRALRDHIARTIDDIDAGVISRRD